MNKYDLYYQVAKDAQADQDQRNRELQDKAVHTARLAVLVFSVGIVVAKAFTDSAKEFSCVDWSILGVAVTCFAIALVATFNVIRPRGWKRSPTVSVLGGYAVNDDWGDDSMTVWAANEIRDCIQSNEPLVRIKSRFLRVAMLGLACQALASVALVVSIRV